MASESASHNDAFMDWFSDEEVEQLRREHEAMNRLGRHPTGPGTGVWCCWGPEAVRLFAAELERRDGAAVASEHTDRGRIHRGRIHRWIQETEEALADDEARARVLDQLARTLAATVALPPSGSNPPPPPPPPPSQAGRSRGAPWTYSELARDLHRREGEGEEGEEEGEGEGHGQEEEGDVGYETDPWELEGPYPGESGPGGLG